MSRLKAILKDTWAVVQNVSVLALFMIYFHIPEKVDSYIEHSENIQKARELLHIKEKQKAQISAEMIEQIQIKGGDVV